MSTRVCCAGRPIPPVGIGSAEVGLPDAAYRACGWEGDRTPRWWPLSYGTHGVGRWGVTAEPCPTCGGRVEAAPAEEPQ